MAASNVARKKAAASKGVKPHKLFERFHKLAPENQRQIGRMIDFLSGHLKFLQPGESLTPLLKDEDLTPAELATRMAERMATVRETLGTTDMGLWEAHDRLRAIATLADEFAWQSNDGPGLEVKQRAIVTAIRALGQAGADSLEMVIEDLDELSEDTK